MRASEAEMQQCTGAIPGNNVMQRYLAQQLIHESSLKRGCREQVSLESRARSEAETEKQQGNLKRKETGSGSNALVTPRDYRRGKEVTYGAGMSNAQTCKSRQASKTIATK